MKHLILLLCLIALALTGCPSDPYDKPCISDGACGEGYYCDTKVPFILLPDLGQCLPFVEVGEYCEKDKQCLGADVGCFDNTCQRKNEGQNCKTDEDCYFENSICAALTKGSQLTCLTRDEVLTTYCREDLLCGPDAYCVYEEDKDYGFCTPRTKPGEVCEDDSTCANTYRCRPAQDGQSRCVHAAGQTCKAQTQCQAGLTCIKEQCTPPTPADMSPDMLIDMPIDIPDMTVSDMDSEMSIADMETDG